jgi:hypothetical protein
MKADEALLDRFEIYVRSESRYIGCHHSPPCLTGTAGHQLSIELLDILSMSKVYESLNLSQQASNVERLGAFVAWLVTNDLIVESLKRSESSAIARIRMQDLTGPEFLTTVLHGELGSAHLSVTGMEFVEHYFVSGTYNEDYNTCEYTGNDEWMRFAEISPKITRAFFRYSQPESLWQKLSAKIIKFPTRFR